MKLILLSGGSENTLWPLSNDYRPKQFIKTFLNSQKELESVFQRIWRQLTVNCPSEKVYISSDKTQVDIIQNQIGTKVPFIIEPEQRGTFPAIALVATYLYSIEGLERNEVVTFMPVDVFVDDDFFSKLIELEKEIVQSGVDIALIGVQPKNPSTDYGYILPNRPFLEEENYKEVVNFTEKPSKELAEKLIKQDGLWNCGVFAFKLDYILNQLEVRNLPTQYDQMLQFYNQLPKISFDYEIVEKANHMAVIPYKGCWNDLRTWNSLTDKIQLPVIGKGMISGDSINSHIINQLDIPTMVVGASDLVVALCSDGLLVADKSKGDITEELVNHINQRPMYEERRWGWYRVLDYMESGDSNKVLTKKILVKAGENLSYQYHFKRSEVWIIVSGEGEFVLDDELVNVKSGDVLTIPKGAKHGVKAIKDLNIIEVQMGTDLQEDDIVRLFMSWEDMKKSIRKGQS